MRTTESGWICLQGRGDCGLWAWQGGNVYALVWRVVPQHPEDKWGRRIVDFKSSDPRALRGFSAMLCKRLPLLMDDLNLNRQKRTVQVTIALPARATQAQPDTPLYKLAKTLCDTLGGLNFRPGLLTKRAHRQLHNISDSQARDDEARKAEYACKPLEGPNPVVLVLDDSVTRGATFSGIRSAILRANQGAQVIPVALGKNVRQDDIGSNNDNDERFGDEEKFWE